MIGLALRSAVAVRRAVAAVVSDAFTRADSTTLGNADTGQPWLALVGATNFGLSTNSAAGNSGSTANVIDAALVNVDVSGTVVVRDGGTAIITRVTDASNFYYAEATDSAPTLYKRVAGTFTSLGVIGAFANNDVLRVLISGSTMTIYRNGVSVLSITDTTFSTQTKHGLWSGPSGRWDNFQIASA